jgi:heme/copper-type cytochrome/quinol oxidase subunit 2
MNAMASGHPHLSGSPEPGPQGAGHSRLAMVGGALAAAAATIVSVVLALFFAATVVVITLMGVIVVSLAGLALRARRSARRSKGDPQVIEARNVGGHSWVAYGWDRR